MRYSLRALLIIVTAAAVLLGWLQWRRQRIAGEIEALKLDGALVSASVGRLWPSVTGLAVIRLQFPDSNTAVVGDREFTLDEAKAYVQEMKARAAGLGLNSLANTPMRAGAYSRPVATPRRLTSFRRSPGPQMGVSMHWRWM